MTRQVTDNLYIELDYFTPEEYYNYEAVAESALAAESTFACDANVIAGGEIVIASGDLPAFATLTVTISHLEGSDMFAFTEAALAAAVDRIRDNNISVTAVFDIATDGRAFRDLAAAPTSLFDFDVVNERSREFNLETQAAFSLAADNTRLKLFSSDLTTTSEIFCVISHIEGADIVAFQNSQVTVSANATSDANSNQFSVFSLNSVIGVKTNAESTVSSAFSTQAFTRILNRNTPVEIRGGGAYRNFFFDSSSKQFVASLGINETGTSIRALTPIISNGTNLRTFGNGYTWTSTDGVNWIRTTNNLIDISQANATFTSKVVNGNYIVRDNSNYKFSSDGSTFNDIVLGTTDFFNNTVVLWNSLIFYNGFYYVLWYVSGSQMGVARSTSLVNGTWNRQVAYGISGVSFPEYLPESMVVGTTLILPYRTSNSSNTANIIYSTNGGSTWNSTFVTETGHVVKSFHGSASDYAIYFGRDTDTGRIRKSTNVGSSSSFWAQVSNPRPLWRSHNQLRKVNNRWFLVNEDGVYSGTTIDNMSLTLIPREQFTIASTNIDYVGSRWVIKYTNEFAYHSTDGVNWTKKLIENQENIDPTLRYTATNYTPRTVDFWWTGAVDILQNSTINGELYSLYIRAATSVRQIVFRTGINISQDISAISNISGWNHFRFVTDGTTGSLYLNGSRVDTANIASLLRTLSDPLIIELRSASRIDELLITNEILTNPSETSFTVPTRQFSNTSNTRLLAHYNVDVLDDGRTPVVERAFLTATSAALANTTGTFGAITMLMSTGTLTTVPEKIVNVNSDILSESAQSVDADKIRQFESNLLSESTMVADVTDIKGIVSDILAETTLTAELTEIVGEVVEASGDWTSTVLSETTPTRIRPLASSLSVDCQQTAVVWRILDFTIETQSLFSPSINVVVQRDSEIALVSQTALTGVILRIRSSSADMSSVSAQSSVIGVVKQFAADAGALFTPDVQVDVIVNPFAQFETTTSLVASVRIIADAVSDQTAESTLSSEVAVTKRFQANANSNLTLSTSADRFRNTDSSISSAADISVVAVKAFGSNTALSSAFDQSATVTRIQSAASDLNSNFEIEASVARTRDDSAIISSEFAQSTVAARTRDLDSTQSSNFSQSVTVVKIHPGVANLTSTSMLVADAVKTTDVLVSATVETTVNAQAVKTVDSTVNAGALFTPNVDINAQLAGVALLESTATMSIAVTRTRSFDNTGKFRGIAISTANNSDDQGPFLRLTASRPAVECFVVSAWVHDPVGTLVDFDGYPTQLRNTLRISGASGVPTFTYYSDGITSEQQLVGGGAVSWKLAEAPLRQTLKGWNHYLLRVNTAEATNNLKYQLYFNGRLLTPSVSTVVSGNFTPTTAPVNLGIRASTRLNLARDTYETNVSGATGPEYTGVLGGLGNTGDGHGPAGLYQFWFDYKDTDVSASDFPVNDPEYRQRFFQGGMPVDMGTQGTLTGLAQPKAYVKLDDHTDISQGGTLSTDTGNWQWLTGVPFVTAGSTVYSIQPYTATELDTMGGDPGAGNPTKLGSTRSDFFITATLVGVTAFATNLQATTALSVEGIKISGITDTLLSEFNLTASANISAGLFSNFVSEFNVNADVERFRLTAAALTSEFTLIASAGFRQQFASDLASEFAFDATTTIIDPIRAEADLNADSTVIVAVTRIKPLLSSMSAETELDAAATIIDPIRAEADLLSESTLAVDALKIVQATSDVNSVFAVSANVSVTVGIITEVQAQVALEAEAFKATGIAPTTLQVNGFVLTAGDVINFDPFLTLKIKQETRGLIIDPENRVISIEQETRLNIIQGY